MDKNYTNYYKKGTGPRFQGDKFLATRRQNNFGSGMYNPKRAVRSFLDLEVYQRALESNVFVAKEIVGRLEKKIGRGKGPKTGRARKTSDATSAAGSSAAGSSTAGSLIINSLFICSSKIPHLIAESHSLRFGSSTKCLDILEEVMLQCNKAVVYLEQTRDICDTGVEWEQFDEQIKKYFYIRRKVLNLQRVWKKYIQNKEND